MKKLHETIRTLRILHGLSKAQMAEKLNIEIRTYDYWESGKTTLSYQKIEAISKIFGMTHEELIHFDSNLELLKHSNPETKEAIKEVYISLIAEKDKKIAELQEMVQKYRLGGGKP